MQTNVGLRTNGWWQNDYVKKSSQNKYQIWPSAPSSSFSQNQTELRTNLSPAPYLLPVHQHGNQWTHVEENGWPCNPMHIFFFIIFPKQMDILSYVLISGMWSYSWNRYSFNRQLGLKVFPGGSDSKESACNVGRHGFDPWVGKIHWRREWQSTPGFLPGDSHEQRSLGAIIHRVEIVRHDSTTTTTTTTIFCI